MWVFFKIVMGEPHPQSFHELWGEAFQSSPGASAVQPEGDPTGTQHCLLIKALNLNGGMRREVVSICLT